MSTRSGRDFGKYTIVHRLRTGGIAEAYLCRLYGIEVVVRRIRPALVTDPALVRTFLEEARIAAHLRHPNIVQVHEIDENNGLPFVVMEHVRGPTLERIIAAAAGDSVRYDGELALVLATIGRALEHAHGVPTSSGDQLQIVHGELCPRNIVISDEGVPKILDFGVAQARGGGTLDPRIDVFALGKCLYHATTGRPPTVTKNGLVRPSEIDPRYPPELELIVLAALEVDQGAFGPSSSKAGRASPPARRLMTAGQLAALLEEFAALPAVAAQTRPLADFLDTLTLDFDEPVSFGSDDGYARKAVGPRGTGAALALVVKSVAKRRWALPLGALTAVCVVSVLAAVATPLFGPRATPSPLLGAQPRTLAAPSRSGSSPVHDANAAWAAAVEPEVEALPPVDIDVRADPQPAPPPKPTPPAPQPARPRQEIRRAARVEPRKVEPTRARTPGGGSPSFAGRVGAAPLIDAAAPAAPAARPPPEALAMNRPQDAARERQPEPTAPTPKAGPTHAVVPPAPQPAASPVQPPPAAAAPNAPAAPTAPPPPTFVRKAVIVPTAIRLPTIYMVQTKAELDKMLGLVEREAVQNGRAPAAVVRGVTRGLGAQLLPRLATGVPLEIHPVAIYTIVVRGALEGSAAGVISGDLRHALASGKL